MPAPILIVHSIPLVHHITHLNVDDKVKYLSIGQSGLF